MHSYKVEINALELIERKVAPDNRENTYSVITRYRCQCGGGEIVRYDNATQNNSFATIKCAECRRRLRPFAFVEGDYFKLTVI